MAEKQARWFHVHRNGKNILYSDGKEKGKLADLTEEERVAIELLERCEKLLEEYSGIVKNGKRLISLDIWKNNLTATVTEYHEDDKHECLAHAWRSPNESKATVFRS